jgi:peptidoglycan/LPS O-acetylase OafA/YrhL
VRFKGGLNFNATKVLVGNRPDEAKLVEPSTAAPKLTYRPDIDGLRAIAVLGVLFFHAVSGSGIGVEAGLSGGFVGVDVFFVISGYLITGLILQELRKGQFHLVKFWERRIRRILPALAAVVITCVIAGWFLLLPDDFKKLGDSVFAQSLLASNIYFCLYTGYFAPPVDSTPLLHTWSLAVEEQFYLLFPLLLIALKYVPRKAFGPVILVLCVLFFSLTVYCSYVAPELNFFMLPTRAWELLIGAWLASLTSRPETPRWLDESLAWAGLAAIFYAMLTFDQHTRFPGVATLFPCGGTALIIWANSRAMTSAGKILSLRPIVFVGLVSYSLYLWHWPILMFASYWSFSNPSALHQMSLLFLSFIVAVLSWKFIETPFRKRLILKTRGQIFSFAGVTFAILMAAGIVVDQGRGFPSRFSPQALAYASGSADQGYRIDLPRALAERGIFIRLGPTDQRLPTRLFVWGDSHAMAVLSIVNTLCQEHGIQALAATHSATAPMLGYDFEGQSSLKQDSIPYNNAVYRFIQANHIGDVFLVARWGGGYGSETTQLHSCLLNTIAALKDAGCRVWILGQVPCPGLNVPRYLAIFGGENPENLIFPLTYFHHDTQIQDQIFAGISPADATILDPTSLFVGPDNQLKVVEGGKCLYFDGHHLSVEGAKRLRPLLEPIFTDIAQRSAVSGN